MSKPYIAVTIAVDAADPPVVVDLLQELEGIDPLQYGEVKTDNPAQVELTRAGYGDTNFGDPINIDAGIGLSLDPFAPVTKVLLRSLGGVANVTVVAVPKRTD